MTSRESSSFLKALLALAVVWFGLGFWITHSSPGAWYAFREIFFFICLDLICLILLFWKLFFNASGQRAKKFHLLLFITFKLVCLGFLAIVLERLRYAPKVGILMGVVFIGVGPLLAGVISHQMNRRLQKRESEQGLGKGKESAAKL